MEIVDFCKSPDFMKLGQAIHHKNWRAAFSVLQRLQKQYEETGEELFGRSFVNLRQCLLRKDRQAAKSALAVVIARRTRILNGQKQEDKGKSMKYKYLLFDLDGTLTDPKEGITTSVQYALRSFGMDEPDLDKLTPFIGPPLRESFMRFYGFGEEQAGEAVEKYREWFRPKGIFQNSIYPGIKEMLEMLEKSGKVLAVASSKPQVFVEQVLQHFDIYRYFRVIVGSELDGRRDAKEEVVAEALRQLEEAGWGKKEESGETCCGEEGAAVMIGDRKFDVAGGKEHGLVTVGVTFGYAEEGELEAAGVDFLVDTVEELGRLLMQ